MDGKSTSARGIAELNIEHYRKLLTTALDEQTRATVMRLLAEEKTKLAHLQTMQRPVPAEGTVDGREAPKAAPSSADTGTTPTLGPQKD